jgi:hypothetical protein
VHQLWVNDSLGLWIAMVVVWRQLHQTIKHVHDCHHEEHSLPVFGLLFVALFNEWFRMWLDIST